MCFLNHNFRLAREMIDSDEIEEAMDDTYFIPLKLSKIPCDMIYNLNYLDLIDEIYVTAMYDLSDVFLTSCDICGQATREHWNPTTDEIATIKKIVERET